MKFIRKKAAAARVGYCDVHMMRKANDPEDDFPAPVQIGANAVGFIEDELTAWQKRRVAERDRKLAAAPTNEAKSPGDQDAAAKRDDDDDEVTR